MARREHSVCVGNTIATHRTRILSSHQVFQVEHQHQHIHNTPQKPLSPSRQNTSIVCFITMDQVKLHLYIIRHTSECLAYPPPLSPPLPLFPSPPPTLVPPTSYTTPPHNPSPRNPSANSYKLPDQAQIPAHPKRPHGGHYCLNLGWGPKRASLFLFILRLLMLNFNNPVLMLIMEYACGMTSAAKTPKEGGPAFKPRKIKKSAEKYRNRAEERRVGADHDYSQVRSVVRSCPNFHYSAVQYITSRACVVL